MIQFILEVSHFKEDSTQNHLVFQLIERYFKRTVGVSNGNYIYYWKFKGLPSERTNSIKISDYGITPYLSYYDTNKIRVKFNGGCLKQDQGTLVHGRIVNIYIVYEITDTFNVSSYPTLENCLFRAVKLTKYADIDKLGYSGYGIRFDKHESFSFGNNVGKNAIIFGVDMSSSTKVDNRKKYIIILGKGPTQELEHTLSAEKLYSNNFTEKKIKNSLGACIIIRIIVSYLLMTPKLLNLNQKILKFFHIHQA